MTPASPERGIGRPLRLLLAAAVTVAVGGSPAALGSSSGDWTGYLRGPEHSSYNAAATSITPANAGNLESTWQWATPASTNVGSNEVLASPVSSDGVVYIGAEDGEFYALRETTGAPIWSAYLGLDAADAGAPCAPTGITGTATVANDPATGTPTVYVNSGDGNLYALDAATGTIQWTAPVDTPSTTVHDYYSWGSPLVANGKIYVGVSSGCDDPLIPGGVVAFDQHTGTQTARWTDVPSGTLGGSVWSTPVLLANGDIAVTTGNGYQASGQPLYNESIVRLDPTTLAVLDWWQVPASQQVRDADFGASPTVWTATIKGTPTPMVGACNKNGLYYAFDQNDLAAGPVWETRITVPYPGGARECDSAAIWDGNRLVIGGGAPTTIGSVSYPGSVQALDPATGKPLWQAGLTGTIVGSPTEDGGGVIAAQTWSTTDKRLGVFLLNAATGAQVGFIQVGQKLFAQPVFANSDLLVAAGGAFGMRDYQAVTAGPPITAVSPATISPNATTTVHLTGSGFTGSPTVGISGSGVTVKSTVVTSSTTLTVKLRVASTAALGPRSITVLEPGPIVDACSNCLTIGTPPPPPAPSSITPGSFAPGTTTTGVTVAGTAFQAGAAVTSHAGIAFSAVTYDSSTELTVTVNVASTVAPGTYNVFVHNPDGYSGECVGCLTVT